MTRGVLRSIFVAILIASAALHGSASADPTDPVSRAMIAVRELRIEDAERVLASIPRALASRPEVRLASAVVAFHKGRYEEANSTLDEIDASLPPELRGYVQGLRPPVAAAARRTRTMATLTSADGRFTVRFGEDDRILAPYVLIQMAESDRVLSDVLGYRHPGPIRAEIYGDPEALSEVSTLSIQAIETTGTIAICKFDRLMLSSPRILSHGYPWARTVSHELVHLLLARATRDHAPTWFHEGVAKFLESAPYFGRPVLDLEEAEKRILHERLVANQMLPFERFHPSVAMLPTPEDAALAYAEAATVASAVFDLRGKEGLVRVLARIAEGVDAREAIAELVGSPFDAYVDTLWQRVKRESAPGDAQLDVPRFVRGHASDDAAEVRSPEAAKRVRLGDMLWSRSHPLAASREYARARAISPDDPIVLSRLGRSALEGGDAQAALSAARDALRLSPNHAPARSLVAAALARAGDRNGAVLAAWDALRYNPFDPSPHCVLAETAADELTRRRERDACQRLSTESSHAE